MLHFEKNNKHRIYTTFTELMDDSTNPVMLEFIPDNFPSETYRVWLEDNLSETSRVDIFEVDLTDDKLDDIEVGLINLPHEGFYQYIAYEYSREETRQALNLIERGRAFVKRGEGDEGRIVDKVYS